MIFRKELDSVKKYVPGKPIREVKAEYNLTDVVKLASNENPLGTSPKALARMHQALDNANIYPDGAQVEARNAIARHWGITPDMVMLGNGGEECIKMIARAIISQGDEVIMNWPSFSLYEIATSIMGGKVVKSELDDDFQPNVDEMLTLVTDKTKMVMICSPNNPTGNIIDSDKLAKLVEQLPQDVVLVLDEAYYEYASVNPNYQNGLEILAKRKNTVLLRTFSKAYGMAGVRAGYIISNAEFISNMSKVKNVFNSNLIAQEGVIGAVEDKDFLRETIQTNYMSLGLLEETFEILGLKYASSNANFIWVDIKSDSKYFNEELLKRGVIVRPGYLWGKDTYLRVSTGTIEQTQRFITAFEDILL